MCFRPRVPDCTRVGRRQRSVDENDIRMSDNRSLERADGGRTRNKPRKKMFYEPIKKVRRNKKTKVKKKMSSQVSTTDDLQSYEICWLWLRNSLIWREFLHLRLMLCLHPTVLLTVERKGKTYIFFSFEYSLWIVFLLPLAVYNDRRHI